MTGTTIYIVQAFKRRGKRLIAVAPVKAADEQEARRRAERGATLTGNVGAMAMAMTGDPDTDDFDEPVILARFGDTPEQE